MKQFLERNDICNGCIMILNPWNLYANITTAGKINREGTTCHIVTIKNVIMPLQVGNA